MTEGKRARGQEGERERERERERAREKMWRCKDVKMWRCEDVKMRRWEDEKMWRREKERERERKREKEREDVWRCVKMCEDVWRCVKDDLCRCEDENEKMWRCITDFTIRRTLRSDALEKWFPIANVISGGEQITHFGVTTQPLTGQDPHIFSRAPQPSPFVSRNQGSLGIAHKFGPATVQRRRIGWWRDSQFKCNDHKNTHENTGTSHGNNYTRKYGGVDSW